MLASHVFLYCFTAMKKTPWLLLILFAFSIAACDDAPDAAAPLVAIPSPAANASFLVVDEVAISRVYAGIHYKIAVDVGLDLGKKLGDKVADMNLTKYDQSPLSTLIRPR
jgi:hypothetical protein